MFRNISLPDTRPIEQIALVSLGLVSVNILWNSGVNGLLKHTIGYIRLLPGVNPLISVILSNEIKGATKLLAGIDSESTVEVELIPIPEKGIGHKRILEIMNSLKSTETSSEEGKAFAYSYTSESTMAEFSKSLRTAFESFADSTHSGRDEQEKVMRDVWNKFMHSNALNPMMYPSLQKFETEICSMATWMLNGSGSCAGSLTSGGTESILMAVKTYRDRARKLRPHITRPNMVVPTTIHPAFEKAGHYFDVDIIHIDLGSDCRVDITKVAAAINSDTILIVGSAPQYCHAVVDPIEELSKLALEKGLPLHVDACFGGFMLPWLEKIGVPIRKWDFRVPGVTSISADVHKYGYSSKGASVVIYRDSELRSYQYFAYSEWPGGLFGSPSMAGSRPGGMIAAAWAALVAMGQDGYMDTARKVWEATKEIEKGVRGIEGLKLMADPEMTALAITSEKGISILAVADAMERRGWKMERQQLPDSLHMSIMPQHVGRTHILVKDLNESVTEVRNDPSLASKGSTGVYGMVAMVPDKGIIDDFIVGFFGKLYTTDKSKSILS
jgi:sphinganine-1-phosphate aldolase